MTDYNNSCLHIYDQKGHFLKRLEYYRLKIPNALSVTSDGRLNMDGIVGYRRNKSNIVSEIHINVVLQT